MSDNVIAGDRDAALKLMRKPFESHQISKMCKSTKKDNQPGRCRDCGGFHKLPSVQLSYVGHAALTDRLLDADASWTWEPLAYAPDGTPFLDANGGMWIKLTVAGVTRLGYGDAQGKVGGDAMKERIGDALRNAAMRFGAALDLWHKGDLHGPEEEDQKFEKQPDGSFAKAPQTPPSPAPQTVQPAKPATKPARKKESVPDAGKPWGGVFDPAVHKAELPATNGQNSVPVNNPPVTGTGNIHGLDIKDEEVPFPGDDKKSDRLPTEDEAKKFRERLIIVKDKGYAGLGQWILKRSGKPRTQDIPYAEIARLVDEVETVEKSGKLKELLEAK